MFVIVCELTNFLTMMNSDREIPNNIKIISIIDLLNKSKMLTCIKLIAIKLYISQSIPNIITLKNSTLDLEFNADKVFRIKIYKIPIDVPIPNVIIKVNNCLVSKDDSIIPVE